MDSRDGGSMYAEHIRYGLRARFPAHSTYHKHLRFRQLRLGVPRSPRRRFRNASACCSVNLSVFGILLSRSPPKVAMVVASRTAVSATVRRFVLCSWRLSVNATAHLSVNRANLPVNVHVTVPILATRMGPQQTVIRLLRQAGGQGGERYSRRGMQGHGRVAVPQPSLMMRSAQTPRFCGFFAEFYATRLHADSSSTMARNWRKPIKFRCWFGAPQVPQSQVSATAWCSNGLA